MTIKDLKPAIVWNNFYQLTRIPRPSKHEEKVQAFLLKWGKEHGVKTEKDATGNIIMRIPATPGYENRRGVILQGHMDMVPQKVASSSHDFLKDPIETIVDGDWLRANGTTLGADNGLGVALGMSVAESKDLKHGPIEVLVTYDEETGMTGAGALKPGVLKGDILLNLDSEDEEELCIGCAGGLDVIADFKFTRERLPETGYQAYKIVVKGLSGGHSGMDISLGRANANKIVANALLPVMAKYGVKVNDFEGGSLRNAIPFEAEALLAVPEKNVLAVLRSVKKYFAEVKACYKESDPDLSCRILKQRSLPANTIDDAVMFNAVRAIVACPSGVIRMSRSMPGLTETSLNLAIVRCRHGHLKVASLLRSAIDASKAELARRVRCIFEMAGAKVNFTGGYSGWVPRPDNPMIKLLNDIHVAKFGKPMNVMATHGGLECAIMGAKYPHWEMISIGPTIRYPHSPDERTFIPSVQRTWDFLQAILEAVPEKRK
ncbi:MAG: aminoacyl-histidine dipeptidase [Bacteroidales bacterium]|nr:aminoacyl-histidine dipeptidase [Bacteroidales bacterium]